MLVVEFLVYWSHQGDLQGGLIWRVENISRLRPQEEMEAVEGR
jgi:hypothetical protein